MERYQRQIIIPSFGAEAQGKISEASVLVIGAGGLGCPVIANLASAGVGTLGIVDFDTIQLNNLNRQFLYSDKDIGKNKVSCAAVWARSCNDNIRVEEFNVLLTDENAKEIIEPYEIVVDCTDSFFSRYLISDTCFSSKKLLVYGAVFRFEGQVAVFDYRKADQNTLSYRDLFPKQPTNPELTDCASAGVLGTSTSLIGTLQANEVIKCITGIGKPLYDKLLVCSLSEMLFRKIKLKKRKLPVADYFGFAPITWKDILALDKEDYVLVDCSVEHSNHLNINAFELDNESAIHFGLELDASKTIIITCERGNKSIWLAQLMKESGVKNELLLVKGGNRTKQEGY